MTQPERWEPDPLMVAAVLSMPKASRKMTELSDPDRAWLVAGLTLAGVTAEDIAERTGCSRRLVMSIRAEDMTQVCKIAQQMVGELDAALCAERSEHSVTRRDLGEKAREAERLRMQLDQVIDAHLAGTLTLLPCGHPRVPWNVYSHTVREKGRERRRDFCRTCGSEKSARYRERKRTNKSDQRNHSSGIAVLHSTVVASSA